MANTHNLPHVTSDRNAWGCPACVANPDGAWYETNSDFWTPSQAADNAMHTDEDALEHLGDEPDQMMAGAYLLRDVLAWAQRPEDPDLIAALEVAVADYHQTIGR